MFDIDTYKQMNAERKQEANEINESRKAILRMSNGQKRQKAWNNLFPKMVRSDDYLSGTVF